MISIYPTFGGGCYISRTDKKPLITIGETKIMSLYINRIGLITMSRIKPK